MYSVQQSQNKPNLPDADAEMSDAASHRHPFAITQVSLVQTEISRMSFAKAIRPTAAAPLAFDSTRHDVSENTTSTSNGPQFSKI